MFGNSARRRHLMRGRKCAHIQAARPARNSMREAATQRRSAPSWLIGRGGYLREREGRSAPVLDAVLPEAPKSSRGNRKTRHVLRPRKCRSEKPHTPTDPKAVCPFCICEIHRSPGMGFVSPLPLPPRKRTHTTTPRTSRVGEARNGAGQKRKRNERFENFNLKTYHGQTSSHAPSPINTGNRLRQVR